jgi:hypothetical protein
MLNVHNGLIGEVYSLQHLLSIHPGVTELHFPANPDLAAVTFIHPTAHYPPTSTASRIHSGTFEFHATPALMASLETAGIQPEHKRHWIIYRIPGSVDPNEHERLAAYISDRFPKARARAFHAAYLARSGNVVPAEKRPHTYYVKDPLTPKRTFEVYIAPDNRRNWSCFLVQNEQPRCDHVATPECESAPYLKNGRRCGHMLAAWMYLHLVQKQEEPSPRPEESSSRVSSNTRPQPHDTTPEPKPQPVSSYEPAEYEADIHYRPDRVKVGGSTRRVVSRYADGRPSRLDDGSIVRYSAGGQAIAIPPSTC